MKGDVEMGSEREEGRDFCGAHPNTSCALINRASTGFRGINGDLPAKRGSPPFIPRPIAPQLISCARRVLRDAGNPAQEHL